MIMGYAGSGKSKLLKVITRNATQIGHCTTDETMVALYQSVSLSNEQFVFIDTPGFGVTGYNGAQINSLVQSALGFATRCFGGIHGILYVHSIETDRQYAGVNQSLAFLGDLKREDGRLPSITVVTTKWDCVRDEERQIYEDRLADLEAIIWRSLIDHDHVQFVCNYDYSSPERRRDARDALAEHLVGRYGGANIESVKMPFWEWTWGEIGASTAKTTVMVTGVCAAVVTFVGVVAGVASGAVAATGTLILDSGGSWCCIFLAKSVCL